jgi:hypothetical protein
MALDNIPGLNDLELTPWLNKPEMLRQCALQLRKDLEPYGMNINLPEENQLPYPIWFEHVKQELQKFINEGGSIKEVMYRVDVNEKWLSTMKKTEESEATRLARLIVWRELQKVVTRYLISRENKDEEGDY